MAGGAPCLERSNRRIIEPAKTAAELKIVRIEAALRDETTGLNWREIFSLLAEVSDELKFENGPWYDHAQRNPQIPTFSSPALACVASRPAVTGVHSVSPVTIEARRP